METCAAQHAATKNGAIGLKVFGERRARVRTTYAAAAAAPDVTHVVLYCC